jgi:hypothetical protein
MRAVPAKQRSRNLSSISVIVKSPLHTSTKTCCHPWPEVSHRAGRGITLPKAIFPNSSPSSVRAVLLSRWVELTTNSLQGEKRASELPQMAHADTCLGKRRVLPFENFTVVSIDRRGKKVNLRVTREIIGRQHTIKRG